jgi:hypothetical protein
MTRKSAYFVLLSCIVVGLLLASYVELVAADSSHSCSVTLVGRAYDPDHHKHVTVYVTLKGTTDGKLASVLRIWISSGKVRIEGWGTFTVIRGYATLIQKCHYIRLTIKIASKYYGGPTAVWTLCGKTGHLHGKTLLLSFYSRRVTLPMRNTPTLYGLGLKGTIART